MRIDQRSPDRAAQARGCSFVDDAGRAQYDAVVAFRRLGRDQPVGDILAHPRRVAREGIAEAAAGRADADEFLAGADLHVRHLRGQRPDAPILADQPQLGRMPGFAAGEPPGGEFVAFALDRGAARGEILELAHRAEATAPFPAPEAFSRSS